MVVITYISLIANDTIMAHKNLYDYMEVKKQINYIIFKQEEMGTI
jgi:hypothetical protein